MIPIRDSIPSRNPPVVLYGLVIINALAFLFELRLSETQLDRFFYLFGIVPARYTDSTWSHRIGLPAGDVWPFLTSMFLHGGWLHILGNMWTLWIFGDNIEDRMGPVRFLLFYLLCGVIAGGVHLLFNPASELPTVGASGAIAGVLGAYFLLFSHSTIVILIPIFLYPLFVQIPALVYLGIWFVIQLFSSVGSLAGPADVGGVAFSAHIGGFIAGMVLCRLFLRPETRHRHPWQRDEYGVEGAWKPDQRLRW